MVMMTKWFNSSDKMAVGNHNSSFVYKNINLEEMIPDGVLESFEATKAASLAAMGLPLQPKRETFALVSKDGHFAMRYFFNFDTKDKQIKTTVRFEYQGENVILRITADEYQKAKKIFEAGVKERESENTP